MKLSVEIDMWEVKQLFDMFNEEKQDDDDDAKDEPCCCDDEPAEADACDRMFPETPDEKAYRKALDDLVECLRAFCNANVSYRVLRNRGL